MLNNSLLYVFIAYILKAKIIDIPAANLKQATVNKQLHMYVHTYITMYSTYT